MSTSKVASKSTPNLKRKAPSTAPMRTNEQTPESKKLNGYFWNLTSNDSEKRIKGAKSIILAVKQAQQNSKPGTKSAALSQVFPRLIEGLGSDRAAFREGSATTLTQLLSTIPEASLPTQMFLDALPAKIDESRVLGILCGVKGGRNLLSEKVVSDLVTAASASRRQREVAVEAIMGMIEADTDGKTVKRIFSPLIKTALSGKTTVPEILAVALTLERRGLLPELENGNGWKRDAKLLDSANFGKISTILMSSNELNDGSKKSLHVLWQSIFDYIYDQRIISGKVHGEWLKNVWPTVEKIAQNGLSNSKSNAPMIIPRLITFIGARIVPGDIETVLSDTSLKIILQLNRNSANKPAIQTLISTLTKLGTQANTEGTEDKKKKSSETSNIFHSVNYLIYTRFIKCGQYAIFTKMFYPKILSKFIFNFTPFDCADYIEKLYKIFAADKAEVTVVKSDSRHKMALRMWAAEQLAVAASVHPTHAPEATLAALRFLFQNAHFYAESGDMFSLKERKFYATQFASLLGRLITKNSRGAIISEDDGNKENTRYWSVELLNFANGLIKDGADKKGKSYKLYSPEEVNAELISKVVKRVGSLAKSVVSGEESTENSNIVKTFVVFLSSMALILGFPVTKVVKKGEDKKMEEEEGEKTEKKEDKEDKDEEMKENKEGEEGDDDEEDEEEDDDEETKRREAEREEINDLINDVLECSNVISTLGKPSTAGDDSTPKKKKKAKKSEGGAEEKDEVSQAMDVLLDVILSVLSRPSKVLRKCAEICFLNVCPYLTKDGLITLTEALTSRDSLQKVEDNDEDMEEEDDDDDDDDGDMDVEEEEDEEEDDDDNDDNIDNEDEDDEDDDILLGDDEDMDSHEKELKEFDKRLAKMFREKNEKKILQIEQTYFKIKVAYLINEYIQKSKKSGHTENLLSLLEPLYNSLIAASVGGSDAPNSSRRDNTGSKQLASRIHRVLNTLLDVKGLRVAPNDSSADLNQLFITMIQGTRSKIPLCIRVSLDASLFLAKALCQSKPTGEKKSKKKESGESVDISKRVRKEPGLDSVYLKNQCESEFVKKVLGCESIESGIGRMDGNACYNLHAILYDILVDKRTIVADFFRRLADKVPTLFWSLIPHILAQIPQLKKKFRIQYAYELVEKAFSGSTINGLFAGIGEGISGKMIGDTIAKSFAAAVTSTLEKLDKTNISSYVMTTKQMYKSITAFVHFLASKQGGSMSPDDVRMTLKGDDVVSLIERKFTEESGFKKSVLFMTSCVKRAFSVGSLDRSSMDQKGDDQPPKQSRKKQKQMARLQAYLERVKAAGGQQNLTNEKREGGEPAAKKQKVAGGENNKTTTTDDKIVKRSVEVRKAKKKFAARRSRELKQ